MFKQYHSKPITRSAHLVTEDDVIVKLDESTSSLNGEVNFKHYEEVKVGDYIVYLNEEDIYHCNAKVFAERNIVDETNKVEFNHIEAMKQTLSYKFARVEDTTVTGCWAFLPNGFQVSYGESACVDPANFNQAAGERYAKERAEYNATNKLWELEGYLLKVTGSISK
jgi:hypothetical protein